VSDAEREQVIGTVKAAFVRGMLAKDEFDLRVSQAFASRTYAELAAVTAALPVEPAAAQPPRPSRAQGGQPVLRPGRVMAAATALYAGIQASRSSRLGLRVPRTIPRVQRSRCSS
jgi:uncharacterized protein DUF1707